MNKWAPETDLNNVAEVKATIFAMREDLLPRTEVVLVPGGGAGVALVAATTPPSTTAPRGAVWGHEATIALTITFLWGEQLIVAMRQAINSDHGRELIVAMRHAINSISEASN